VTAKLLLELRILWGIHILCPALVLYYSSLPLAFLCLALLTWTGTLVNPFAYLGYCMIVVVSPSFWEIDGWDWRQSSVTTGADQAYLHDFLSFIFLDPTSTFKCYWKWNFILFGFGLYDQDWLVHTGSFDVLYCTCISFLELGVLFTIIDLHIENCLVADKISTKCCLVSTVFACSLIQLVILLEPSCQGLPCLEFRFTLCGIFSILRLNFKCCFSFL